MTVGAELRRFSSCMPSLKRRMPMGPKCYATCIRFYVLALCLLVNFSSIYTGWIVDGVAGECREKFIACCFWCLFRRTLFVATPKRKREHTLSFTLDEVLRLPETRWKNRRAHAMRRHPPSYLLVFLLEKFLRFNLSIEDKQQTLHYVTTKVLNIFQKLLWLLIFLELPVACSKKSFRLTHRGDNECLTQEKQGELF